MAKEFDVTNHVPESDGMSEKELTKILTEPSWLDVPLVDIKKFRDAQEDEILAIEEKHKYFENTYNDKQDLKHIARDPAGYVESKINLYSPDEKEDLKYLKNLADKKSVDPTTQPYRTDTVKKFDKLKEKLENPRPSFNPTDPTNWGKNVHQVLDEQAKYEAELKELGLPKDFKKNVNRPTTNVSKLFKANKSKSNWDYIRDTAKDPEDRKQIRQILNKDFNKTNGKGMSKADLQYIGKWVDPAAAKKQDKWEPISYAYLDIPTKPTTVEDIKKEINQRVEKSKRKTNGGLDDIIDDAMFSLRNPWINGGSDE